MHPQAAPASIFTIERRNRTSPLAWSCASLTRSLHCFRGTQSLCSFSNFSRSFPVDESRPVTAALRFSSRSFFGKNDGIGIRSKDPFDGLGLGSAVLDELFDSFNVHPHHLEPEFLEERCAPFLDGLLLRLDAACELVKVVD